MVHDRYETKEKREDERRIDPMLTAPLERYLAIYRPLLIRGKSSSTMWLSANDGNAMTENGIAKAIAVTTLETLGVNLCPHLFRTSAASTAAIYGGANPHLGSATLNHRNPKITNKSYNFATGISAAEAFAKTLQKYVAP